MISDLSRNTRLEYQLLFIKPVWHMISDLSRNTRLEYQLLFIKPVWHMISDLSRNTRLEYQLLFIKPVFFSYGKILSPRSCNTDRATSTYEIGLYTSF